MYKYWVVNYSPPLKELSVINMTQIIGQFFKTRVRARFCDIKAVFYTIILASATCIKYLKVLTKVTISEYKALKNK